MKIENNFNNRNRDRQWRELFRTNRSWHHRATRAKYDESTRNINGDKDETNVDETSVDSHTNGDGNNDDDGKGRRNMYTSYCESLFR